MPIKLVFCEHLNANYDVQSMMYFLLLCLWGLPSSFGRGIGVKSETGVLVPPIFTQPIEGVFFYEKTAPIVYKFFYPTFQDKTLMVFDMYCRNPSADKYCPLLFYLQTIVNRLRPVITSETKLQKNDASFTYFTYKEPDLCTDIQQNFNSLYTNHKLLSNYVSELEMCSRGIHDIRNDPIMDYSQSFETLYNNAHISYDSTYYRNPDTPLEASHSAVLALLTSLGILHYQSESRRWEDAVTNCKHLGTIPSSLVTSELLSSSLHNIFYSSLQSNYRLSIPIDDENISRYWDLRGLTDCSFSTEIATELYVRILVPLRKANEIWTAHRVLGIPFRHEYNNISYICFAQSHEKTMNYIYESADNVGLIEEELGCNLSQNKHCAVHKAKSEIRRKRFNCVTAVLSGQSAELIAKYCSLACEPTDNYKSLIVRRGRSDMFFISGDLSTNVSTICPSDASNTSFVIPAVGALQLILPCDCYIQMNMDNLYSYQPCSNQMISTTVLPVNLNYIFYDS